MTAPTVILSRIVLLVRSGAIESSVNFYHHALGLPIIRITDEWAELCTSSSPEHPNSSGVILSLQAVNVGQESQLCVGYTPWITFTVANLDTTIASCVQHGANLDGPIQYPANGKIALIRTPTRNDNQMVGLYQPNQSNISNKNNKKR